MHLPFLAFLKKKLLDYCICNKVLKTLSAFLVLRLIFYCHYNYNYYYYYYYYYNFIVTIIINIDIITTVVTIITTIIIDVVKNIAWAMSCGQ